jgi:hypothetical protein
LRGLLTLDNGHSAWPLFDNQPVNSALIESVNLLSQGTIGYQPCIVQTSCLSAPANSIWIAAQRVAVSIEPSRQTCLSSSMVAFCRWAMSKDRAID